MIVIITEKGSHGMQPPCQLLPLPWRDLQWVKKSPLRFSDIFFTNGGELLIQILHAYYTFLLPSYARLQIFI